MPGTNASSLTFSDLTVNSIFSINNTIFSHYTLNEIKNSVLNSDIFTTLNTSLSNHNTSIVSIDSSISTINTDITILNTSVSNHNTDITILNTSVSNHNTDITILNTSVSNHNTDITILNTSVSNHDTDITILNTSVSNHDTDITTLNTSLYNHNTSIISIDSSISTINTNITTLNTSVSNHNTSINTLVNDLGIISLKTNLIDISGSTSCSFGLTNMSRVYIGNNNTSVYIGGVAYSSGVTISSLSSPLTISYTPASLTSSTMIGYVITTGNVITTKNSTQFESTDIDLPNFSTYYYSYGIRGDKLARITVPSGVWMISWLMDVYDAGNQLNYDNYLATGVTNSTYTGTGGALHQAASWTLAKQAGVSQPHSVYPLTDTSFYVGSYYIGKFLGVNQSTKTSTDSVLNYSQYGSRTIISNNFIVSVSNSTTLNGFFGMAGQPTQFNNIVFTNKITATRIG
jgi:hypothetical protein